MTPVSVETVHRPNTTTPYLQVQLSLESSRTQTTSDCKESNLIQVVSCSSFQQIFGMYRAGIRDAVVEPGFPGVGWHMHWEVWDRSLTQVVWIPLRWFLVIFITRVKRSAGLVIYLFASSMRVVEFFCCICSSFFRRSPTRSFVLFPLRGLYYSCRCFHHVFFLTKFKKVVFYKAE